MTAATTYDVVLLVEQALSPLDAQQVRSLHEEIDAAVRYHVLQPVDDAAERIETAMGSLATGDALAGPPLAMDPDDVDELQHELLQSARGELERSLSALRSAGADATGDIVVDEPVHALVEKVKQVSGGEVIVLTRPHVVAELFHMDWSSRARRKLGVPVLHLLEHETFDEQANPPEGVTGL